mmetsp:Transcript_74561/g.161279  ORF Transcript_74561/g.161279 Transcript_74561/m.161279 type:complete len:297 (+) Transcript_74561:105-995(+)
MPPSSFTHLARQKDHVGTCVVMLRDFRRLGRLGLHDQQGRDQDSHGAVECHGRSIPHGEESNGGNLHRNVWHLPVGVVEAVIAARGAEAAAHLNDDCERRHVHGALCPRLGIPHLELHGSQSDRDHHDTQHRHEGEGALHAVEDRRRPLPRGTGHSSPCDHGEVRAKVHNCQDDHAPHGDGEGLEGVRQGGSDGAEEEAHLVRRREDVEGLRLHGEDADEDHGGPDVEAGHHRHPGPREAPVPGPAHTSCRVGAARDGCGSKGPQLQVAVHGDVTPFEAGALLAGDRGHRCRRERA